MDQHSRDIEAATRAKYSGGVYQPDNVSVMPADRPADYTSRMLALKLDLIREYCSGEPLLDVCCSTGLQLAALAGPRRAIGIDFSAPFLARAASTQHSIDLICANARVLPLATGAIGAAYSLSSLYSIPNVSEAILEIGRVLRPGGRCLLDMGNLHSLNTTVCRAYPEFATPCHVPVAAMRRMIHEAGMRVLVHRKFQILPMWGDRPARLKWLMHPKLIRFMTREIGGRMLDEWVSSLPVLRRFAFRHLWVCERTA